MPSPSSRSRPRRPAVRDHRGPDGNLWFTEFGAGKIGDDQPDDPRHRRVRACPTTVSAPAGSRRGPDGNLWFTDGERLPDRDRSTRSRTPSPRTSSPPPTAPPLADHRRPRRQSLVHRDNGSKVGVVTPAHRLSVTSEPPAWSRPTSAFGADRVRRLQFRACPTRASTAGDITLALINPGGATLGGTLTVACHNGVASFSGLTISEAGAGYDLMASITPLDHDAHHPSHRDHSAHHHHGEGDRRWPGPSQARGRIRARFQHGDGPDSGDEYRQLRPCAISAAAVNSSSASRWPSGRHTTQRRTACR